jgi:hypothetical protein
VPVALACNPSYPKIVRITVRSQLRQIALETLSQKYLTKKRTVRMTQVVEHLLSKHKALSSNSSAAKKVNKNK